MTSEFIIFQKLPECLKSACVDLENLDPNTLKFVTGEQDEDGWTYSGFKLKSTNQWHLVKRIVASSDGCIIERMMNSGRECGIGREFHPEGHVLNHFRNDDSIVCGELILCNADGSFK